MTQNSGAADDADYAEAAFLMPQNTLLRGQRRSEPMTHLFLACSAVVLVATLSLAAGANQNSRAEDDRAALTQIQQDLAKAWVSGDRAAIERIIAPGWRSTGPDGRSSDRASVFGDVFEKRVHRIRRLEIDDVSIQVFGDAAVVRGRTLGAGDFAGAPYDVVIRFTDTFVRRAGHWQAVASHSSLEAPR